MNNNYLNIKEEDKEKYIYRIISFEKLMEMFETEKMTLFKPRLWEDPFENYILNYFEKDYKKENFDFNFRNSLYANCWSLNNRSDALWRIYSPSKNGVCIRSTIMKLFKSLYDKGGHYSKISCFIGKVIYLPQGVINKKLDNFKKNFNKNPIGSGLADTLLFKRTAFEYEKEIRLISHEPIPNNQDYYKYDFYPHLVIDQVTFDPRMGENAYKSFSSYFKDMTQFKGKVRKSSLYKIPKSI